MGGRRGLHDNMEVPADPLASASAENEQENNRPAPSQNRPLLQRVKLCLPEAAQFTVRRRRSQADVPTRVHVTVVSQLDL